MFPVATPSASMQLSASPGGGWQTMPRLGWCEGPSVPFSKAARYRRPDWVAFHAFRNTSNHPRDVAITDRRRNAPFPAGVAGPIMPRRRRVTHATWATPVDEFNERTCRQHVASRRRHGTGLLIHCTYGFLPMRSRTSVLRECCRRSRGALMIMPDDETIVAEKIALPQE